MPHVSRCDGCSAESAASRAVDWFEVNQWGRGRESLVFCSESCICNYFSAKKLIEGIA